MLTGFIVNFERIQYNMQHINLLLILVTLDRYLPSNYLSHFMPLVSFTTGFLKFSGGIERDHCYEKG